MKKIFMIAGIVGAIACIYFLYQKQLGSIGFFLLSIYFFSLAVNQLSKKANSMKEKDTDLDK